MFGRAGHTRKHVYTFTYIRVCELNLLKKQQTKCGVRLGAKTFITPYDVVLFIS